MDRCLEQAESLHAVANCLPGDGQGGCHVREAESRENSENEQEFPLEDDPMRVSNDAQVGLHEAGSSRLAEYEQGGLHGDDDREDGQGDLPEDDEGGESQGEEGGESQDEEGGLSQDEQVGLLEDDQDRISGHERAGACKDDQANISDDDKGSLREEGQKGIPEKGGSQSPPGSPREASVSNGAAEPLPSLSNSASDVAADKPQAPAPGLPLLRVKRIMRLDEDVHLVTSEALKLVTRATELFLETLSESSYEHISRMKRRTIRAGDVQAAVQSDQRLRDCVGDSLVSQGLVIDRSTTASVIGKKRDSAGSLAEGAEEFPEQKEKAAFRPQRRKDTDKHDPKARLISAYFLKS